MDDDIVLFLVGRFLMVVNRHVGDRLCLLAKWTVTVARSWMPPHWRLHRRPSRCPPLRQFIRWFTLLMIFFHLTHHHLYRPTTPFMVMCLPVLNCRLVWMMRCTSSHSCPNMNMQVSIHFLTLLSYSLFIYNYDLIVAGCYMPAYWCRQSFCLQWFGRWSQCKLLNISRNPRIPQSAPSYGADPHQSEQN